MRMAPVAAALLAVPLFPLLPALVCSKGSLWAPLDEGVVYVTGTASAGTLFAGPGALEFGVGGGHFGPRGQRPIHGRVVAVEALGGPALAGLPQGVEEVVVVSWDSDPSRRPLAWGRSAHWVPTGTNAFYIADLRAPVEMLVHSVVGAVDRVALSRIPNGLLRTVYGRIDPESTDRWTPSRTAT